MMEKPIFIDNKPDDRASDGHHEENTPPGQTAEVCYQYTK